jgi:hypothetical protein
MYQIYEHPWKAFLVRTENGKYYEKLVKIEIAGDPSESTIRFDRNDKMYVLIRNDGGDRMGVLAESDFPYRDLSYNPLKIKLGGPNFLFLNSDHLVIASRYYEKTGSSTALLVTDLEGNVLKTMKLPSGGDTSYPGMVIYKNKLWVAYYSSHEGKTSIYMAVIPIKELSANQQ